MDPQELDEVSAVLHDIQHAQRLQVGSIRAMHAALMEAADDFNLLCDAVQPSLRFDPMLPPVCCPIQAPTNHPASSSAVNRRTTSVAAGGEGNVAECEAQVSEVVRAAVDDTLNPMMCIAAADSSPMVDLRNTPNAIDAYLQQHMAAFVAAGAPPGSTSSAAMATPVDVQAVPRRQPLARISAPEPAQALKHLASEREGSKEGVSLAKYICDVASSSLHARGPANRTAALQPLRADGHPNTTNLTIPLLSRLFERDSFLHAHLALVFSAHPTSGQHLCGSVLSSLDPLSFCLLLPLLSRWLQPTLPSSSPSATSVAASLEPLPPAHVRLGLCGTAQDAVLMVPRLQQQDPTSNARENSRSTPALVPAIAAAFVILHECVRLFGGGALVFAPSLYRPLLSSSIAATHRTDAMDAAEAYHAAAWALVVQTLDTLQNDRSVMETFAWSSSVADLSQFIRQSTSVPTPTV